MADKLTSQDHKDAIALLMANIMPFVSEKAFTGDSGVLLQKTIAASINPKKWKRESKRTNVEGHVVRRFVDQYVEITVDTIEQEIEPGVWRVACDLIEAPAWISLATREYVASLTDGVAIDMKKGTFNELKAPRSLKDEDNKPSGYGAFA